MARSRLSIHAIPHHDPGAILPYARALQPPVILIVNPDPGFISECYTASPASLFSLRNHPLSEQKNDLYADPVATGQRHAREVIEWCNKLYAEAAVREIPMPPLDQVLLPGINEPLVDTDGEINAVVSYNVHYLDGLTARGRRGTGLEFSVGWPRNSGADQPPEWEAWRPVYEALKRGNHIASIHEYWPHEGPSFWASWLCYRLVTWIPDYWADVPFIITECGLDDAAIPGRAHNFWKNFFLNDPRAYVRQYQEYEWNCRSLANRNGVKLDILGYCVFTNDYGSNDWESADIKTITSLFAEMVNTVDMPEISATRFTTHLPLTGTDKPVEPKIPIEHSEGDASGWVIDSMSRIFGYDPILARAILRVESGGRAFQDGKPIIRNEVHIMRDKMENKALFDRHFRFNATRRWEDQQWRRSEADAWRYVHIDQATEWTVFEFAKTLDARAAHLALGIGAGQIMGFNYTIPGYASPEQMLISFSDPVWGGANQIVAMFAYFYKVEGLVEAIRVGDLATIALKYNGPGQVDYYVKRFQEELDALRG